jgi:hypothetical protein
MLSDGYRIFDELLFWHFAAVGWTRVRRTMRVSESGH